MSEVINEKLFCRIVMKWIQKLNSKNELISFCSNMVYKIISVSRVDLLQFKINIYRQYRLWSNTFYIIRHESLWLLGVKMHTCVMISLDSPSLITIGFDSSLPSLDSGILIMVPSFCSSMRDIHSVNSLCSSLSRCGSYKKFRCSKNLKCFLEVLCQTID